jgi:adenylate cyclase
LALEIERKFLTVGDAWRGQATRSERIVDGLLATSKGRKVRVRLYGDRATLAIKTRKKGRVRFEFEYVIPVDDAQHMLKTECGRSILAKTRHYVLHDGGTWEVDEYEAPLAGIVLAEVELADVDQELSLPDWVGREVTEDPAFRKTRLFAERAGQRFHPARRAAKSKARTKSRPKAKRPSAPAKRTG